MVLNGSFSSVASLSWPFSGIEVCVFERGLPLSLRAVTAMTLTNLAVQDESALAIAEAGGVNALIQCMGILAWLRSIHRAWVHML